MSEEWTIKAQLHSHRFEHVNFQRIVSSHIKTLNLDNTLLCLLQQALFHLSIPFPCHLSRSKSHSRHHPIAFGHQHSTARHSTSRRIITEKISIHQHSRHHLKSTSREQPTLDCIFTFTAPPSPTPPHTHAMPIPIETWYYDVPLVTRLYATGAALVALAVVRCLLVFNGQCPCAGFSFLNEVQRIVRW